MPDIFISYSTKNEKFAKFLHRHLTSEGLDVFLASVSLRPGQHWPQKILSALKGSGCVLFLASRSACASPWVQQELGAALATQKKLVPIVWDMPPSELPGWVRHFHALNLAGNSVAQVKVQMSDIATTIKVSKARGQLIGALALAGLFVLASSK